MVFINGQLVQIYRSDLDYTFKTERKLLPKWSAPQRVVSRLMNSYVLETVNGERLPGTFSARRLRTFIPKEGTKLAEEQRKIEELNIQKERQGPEGTEEDSDDTLAPAELQPDKPNTTPSPDMQSGG